MVGQGIPLRRDAERNRQRILAAAGELITMGEPVQLNAVARLAEVGVGTVYRHYPTAQALLEALVAQRIAGLIDQARALRSGGDPVGAFRAFLRSALTAYLADETFATVVGNANPAREETRRLRSGLLEELGHLLGAVRAAGRLHAMVNPEDAVALLCGLAYAVRLAPDREPETTAEIYLAALLGGLLTDVTPHAP